MSASTVALVGCVKTKRPGTHPAQDLYISPLFVKRRAYVERHGLPWFILSAEHGLVAPMDRLAAYERTLNTMSAAERRAWGTRVLDQLVDRLGAVAGVTFEMHAGARYVEAIAGRLREGGATVTVPTQGLGLGRQLQWYREQASRVPRRVEART